MMRRPYTSLQRAAMHRALDRALDSAPQEGRKFTITASGSSEFLDGLERQLAYLAWCGQVGHSCTVGINIDGDGSDRIEVEGISGKIDEGKVINRRGSYEQVCK